MTTPTFDAATEAILQNYGFDRATFERLATRLRRGEADAQSGHIDGEVTPPQAGDVTPLPALGSDERNALSETGRALMNEGRVASVVLAGGMATRFGGVVKALVPAIDQHTFLDLKVADARHAGKVPLYFMTSFATDDGIKRALEAGGHEANTFPQFVSVRMREDGELFTHEGAVSLYAPGHGDLSFALRRAGVIDALRERGVRYLVMSNVDNLSATLDPAIVALHVELGKPMSAEVAPKAPGDKGGAPARVDGVPQIVEGFRFPGDFDQDRIDVFNTNTLVFDLDALDRDFDLTWFAVRKQVEGQTVVQFERLVGQLSAMMPVSFIRIEREGADARFQPVKDPAELERRQPAIRAALEARGVL